MPVYTLFEAEQEAKREAFDAGATGWVAWNTGYTAATSATSVPLAWGAWNVTYTGTSGSTMVYDACSNTAISLGTPSAPQWTYWNTVYQETEDQRAEREERIRAENERWAAEQERRNAEQAAVKARSQELLRSLLSDEQWASYQGNGWFEVRGSKGGRWRIRDRGQSTRRAACPTRTRTPRRCSPW